MLKFLLVVFLFSEGKFQVTFTYFQGFAQSLNYQTSAYTGIPILLNVLVNEGYPFDSELHIMNASHPGHGTVEVLPLCKKSNGKMLKFRPDSFLLILFIRSERYQFLSGWKCKDH